MLHIFNISSVQELYIYIYHIYIYHINISQFSKLFPFPEELVCESSKTNQKMFNTFLKFKNCKTVSLFLTTMTATIAKTLTTCLKCSRQCQKNPAALNLDNCVGLRSSQILTTMFVPTSLGTIVKLRAAANIPGNYFHIFQKPALLWEIALSRSKPFSSFYTISKFRNRSMWLWAALSYMVKNGGFRINRSKPLWAA